MIDMVHYKVQCFIEQTLNSDQMSMQTFVMSGKCTCGALPSSE